MGKKWRKPKWRVAVGDNGEGYPRYVKHFEEDDERAREFYDRDHIGRVGEAIRLIRGIEVVRRRRKGSG